MPKTYAGYELVVHTLQNWRYSKFLRSIIPEKQQKCKAKYFVCCTKVSSCNNNKQDNILQKHLISWHDLALQPPRQANFHAV